VSHPVVEWQIVTANPEQTAQFYGRVFGWQISTRNALGYREVSSGPDGVRGGIWPAPPDHAAFVQLFIRVPSVAQAISDATDHGATLVIPETTLPDGATMAILHDPSGMSFGLVQASLAPATTVT